MVNKKIFKNINILSLKIILFLPYTSEADEYLFSDHVINKANNSKCLVAITAHYNPTRLDYLKKVVESLSTLPKTDIVLITNTNQEKDLQNIVYHLNPVVKNSSSQMNISINIFDSLSHPFFLTWCHKPLIKDRFLNQSSEYTHFIYLEDDMTFDFDNLCYFIEFRDLLKKEGLIPSFLRVEYNKWNKTFFHTDQFVSVNLNQQAKIKTEKFTFVNMPNPYCAIFVLDLDLAKEYITTKSFDIVESSFSGWDVRERATQGLCFENIPNCFKNRYVVPVDLNSLQAPKFCWISHLPNNYAENPFSPFAKVAMNKLFSLEEIPNSDLPITK